MDYAGLIERAAIAKRPLLELSSELFLLGPTHGFVGWEEQSFALFQSIARFFRVSVRSVHVCGSAKLGFSPTKLTAFANGASDLDIAIVDAGCYQWYVETILAKTKNYRDWTLFKRGDDGRSSFDDFKFYVSKGMLRPDLMPNIPERGEWLRFFREITRVHKERFKSISAAVYLSDAMFAMKQTDALQNYIEQKGFL